jgi:hypothetical protein
MLYLIGHGSHTFLHVIITTNEEVVRENVPGTEMQRAFEEEYCVYWVVEVGESRVTTSKLLGLNAFVSVTAIPKFVIVIFVHPD